MESYSKEILRKKVINRILKCSSDYTFSKLEKLDMAELFTIQSSAFRSLLVNPNRSANSRLKQTY
jgi:hypothetical protein